MQNKNNKKRTGDAGRHAGASFVLFLFSMFVDCVCIYYIILYIIHTNIYIYIYIDDTLTDTGTHTDTNTPQSQTQFRYYEVFHSHNSAR